MTCVASEVGPEIDPGALEHQKKGIKRHPLEIFTQFTHVMMKYQHFMWSHQQHKAHPPATVDR